MKILTNLVIALLFFILGTENVFAITSWEFKKTYESKNITSNPIVLATTADLNGNGTNDIIFSDFSLLEGGDVDRTLTGYNLYVLEWQNNQLHINYHKDWNPLKHLEEGFKAFKAMQLVPWKIDGKVIVEALPPYFALEWKKNKYILHNERVWGPEYEDTLDKGSWTLPWISPACYGFGVGKGPQWNVKAKPRECLLGIRDFAGDGNPKIVSVLVEEIIKDKKYKQTLRVRSFKPGFPIEWQMVNPDRFDPWHLSARDNVDLFNWSESNKILEFGLKNDTWYVLQQNKEKQNYELKKIRIDKLLDVKAYILPYIYLRTTQTKGIEEYWGYHFVKGSDNSDVPVLGKDVLRTDLTGFDFQNIEFEHHEPYLGVSYFDAKDIDGDGIDEVILVERTGKRKIGEENTIYSNIKEYIHILKWNGQKYQTMWVSPPYTKMGTKFLVDDVKNTGKKQLVVLTPDGTIQIWERQ